ncbi:MAG TPA: hypothetical protein PKG96_02715 [Bacilli bacterium]|jgi:hypothetical protein|nr:hypothetical protein [Bacilli bacterium]NLT01276.1 hypothetical protein [Acholeplasmataceae bacterium]HNZ78009.1 hypothetical protein [Bacilli bacterium]HOD61011.1 hypothetical protein [Bacilli bacterium]HOE06472.1 hypothetical protein [Bacilli bacterium]
MQLIIDFFTNMDNKVEVFIKPIMDWLTAFFEKGGYFVFLVVGAFVVILVLAGIIGMLKKAKFLFFLFLFIAAVAYLLWHFVVL